MSPAHVPREAGRRGERETRGEGRTWKTACDRDEASLAEVVPVARQREPVTSMFFTS